MKTPERWRALPRRSPCQYSSPIDLSTQTFHTLQQTLSCLFITWWPLKPNDVTWRPAVALHDIKCHDKIDLNNLHQSHHQKNLKVTFFNLVTLTFDLWPWHSNSSEIISRYIRHPNFESICPTVHTGESWQTHRHTDRRDRFYTLDR